MRVMRKRSKLVVFLVMLTFLFSIAGTASAAFSDIADYSGKSDIMRLTSLGVINGYPDGTFKPNGDITRAEFAKIAVCMAGLQEVAPGMEGMVGPFKDVKVGDWYNGWVNIAAAQGYVKGYPDGTFGPNNKVTQQEVVTVLMRLLGYNDNLPGEWPFDYLAKASKLGLLDDVTLAAAAPATRGIVAILASAALDEEVVEYNADSNTFPGQGKTLLEDNFKEGQSFEDVFVKNFAYDNGKKYLVKNDGTKIELADDVTVFGAANWIACRENIVDYILTTDDKTASYVEVKNYGIKTFKDEDATFNFISFDNNGSFDWRIDSVVIDDKTYDFDATVDQMLIGGVLAQSALDVYFGAPAAAGEKESKKWDHVDLVKLYPNDDGDYVAAKLAPQYPSFAVVDSVDTERNIIKFKNDVDKVLSGGSPTSGPYAFKASRIDLDDYEDDFFVMRNGAPAKIGDLKENDLVYNNNGDRGVTYVFEAYRTEKTGELEAITEKSGNSYEPFEVTVAGTKYLLSNFCRISTDGGDDFDSYFDGTTCTYDTDALYVDLANLLGEQVTLILDPMGQVALVISDTEGEGNKIYGVVTDIIDDLPTSEGESNYVRVLKADGTKVSYQVDEDSTKAARDFAGFDYDFNDDGNDDEIDVGGAVDDFIYLTLRSNGKVDDIQVVTDAVKVSVVDADNNKRFKWTDDGGVTFDWSTVDSDVVVFNLSGYDVESWSDTYDTFNDTVASEDALIYDSNDDGLVDYIVINTTLTQTDYYMVMSKYRNADGYFLVLDRAGTSVTKECTDSVYKATYKFDLGTYTTSEGEIKSFTQAWTKTGGVPGAETGTPKTVNDVDVSNNQIKIDGTWYSVDEDTVYYEIDEDDPISATLEDVFDGDEVNFAVDTTDGVILWLVFDN